MIEPTPARMAAVSAPSGASELLPELVRAWQQRFGRRDAPRVFFAPGRVNLMGAHLDYNGGPVMPVAVDRGTFVALGPRGDGRLRLASRIEPGECEIDLALAAHSARSGAWFDYPLGVALALCARRPRAVGLDVLFGGNLPIGGGLSSSASICVGTSLAFERAWGIELSSLERIEVALWAEREFVGVKCGIMDPTSIALARRGRLLWLDCRDRSFEHVALDDARIAIGVADSGVRRELARGDFNLRVEQCRAAFEQLRRYVPGATCLRDVPAGVLASHAAELEPVVARRALHVVSEVERTFAARDALARGELAAFGELMVRTHASLRDAYEVSLPELDCLSETACALDGVYGARLTGAGFGGCVVVLLHPRASAALAPALEAEFARRFGRVPRVTIYASSDGPRELEL
ncbi:MAG: galactokinase [Planctomycetota bacterium]|nr:MAG: galactokinase [Planctomycetota bacterium]